MTKPEGKAETNTGKKSKKDGDLKVTREKTRTRGEVRKETVAHKQNGQKGG